MNGRIMFSSYISKRILQLVMKKKEFNDVKTGLSIEFLLIVQQPSNPVQRSEIRDEGRKGWNGNFRMGTVENMLEMEKIGFFGQFEIVFQACG